MPTRAMCRRITEMEANYEATVTVRAAEVSPLLPVASLNRGTAQNAGPSDRVHR